jgi:hypothetical protein
VPRVGAGTVIPVIERSKPVGALDLAEAVFGVLYPPTEIIRVVIWRRLKWTRYVACSGSIRDINVILVTKNLKDKIPWETRHRLEDNFQLSILTRLRDCCSWIPRKRMVSSVLRSVHTGWGSHCILYIEQRIVFPPGAKWPWRESNHLYPLGAQIKNPSPLHTSSCRVPQLSTGTT